MTESEMINRRCAEIADRVVPEYRSGPRSYSCGGRTAKRWSAAYEGARLGLGLAAGGESRGFWRGLDHVANFINALDTSAMSAKDVRSAIYSECLTARPLAAPRASRNAGEIARIVSISDERGDFVTGCDGYVVYWPGAPGTGGAYEAWTLRAIADELDARNAAWDAQVRSKLAALTDSKA